MTTTRPPVLQLVRPGYGYLFLECVEDERGNFVRLAFEIYDEGSLRYFEVDPPMPPPQMGACRRWAGAEAPLHTWLEVEDKLGRPARQQVRAFFSGCAGHFDAFRRAMAFEHDGDLGGRCPELRTYNFLHSVIGLFVEGKQTFQELSDRLIAATRDRVGLGLDARLVSR